MSSASSFLSMFISFLFGFPFVSVCVCVLSVIMSISSCTLINFSVRYIYDVLVDCLLATALTPDYGAWTISVWSSIQNENAAVIKSASTAQQRNSKNKATATFIKLLFFDDGCLFSACSHFKTGNKYIYHNASNECMLSLFCLCSINCRVAIGTRKRVQRKRKRKQKICEKA